MSLEVFDFMSEDKDKLIEVSWHNWCHSQTPPSLQPLFALRCSSLNHCIAHS